MGIWTSADLGITVAILFILKNKVMPPPVINGYRNSDISPINHLIIGIIGWVIIPLTSSIYHQQKP
jgi:Mn2+/Fe2+ NRAMP family transporter